MKQLNYDFREIVKANGYNVELLLILGFNNENLKWYYIKYSRKKGFPNNFKVKLWLPGKFS